MSRTRQITGGGGVPTTHRIADRYRPAGRGYAQRRQDYDRRRRARTKTAADREWEAILRRDPCAFCPPGRRLHEQIAVDHIHALDCGGADEAANQTAACRACNAAKKNKPLLMFLLERRAA